MIKGESVFGLVPVIFWVSIERAPVFFHRFSSLKLHTVSSRGHCFTSFVSSGF